MLRERALDFRSTTAATAASAAIKPTCMTAMTGVTMAVITMDAPTMRGAGTTIWSTIPMVCCRLVMSEVVRVIIDETPTSSNWWRESSWLLRRSRERISKPKRAPRSAVTQLPAAATAADSRATASICPPVRRMASISPGKMPRSTTLAIRAGMSSVPTTWPSRRSRASAAIPRCRL